MSNNFTKKGVTTKEENFSDWYVDVITKSQMADYAPVKGCIVYRPLSYAIWENIQKFLDTEFKTMDIQNSYFPIFIPESFLKKEAAHVEGFSPELAVVTIGGGEQLTEKLAVRPTSETIMYDMYAKWIQSHRDLPLKLNQWNNVVRWEKRTYFFMRGLEFLWQEAHTAHATHEECFSQVLQASLAYKKTYEELLAIPVQLGLKSQAEKFAGADNTITCEIMMPDGKALQAATSHDLGQNFSKAFDIKFQDQNGHTQYVHQTSFGYSTRALGALVMIHGDNSGLVLPPQVAPTQIVIIPIQDTAPILKTAENLKLDLENLGFRVKLDLRTTQSLGFKRNEHELQGVPFRLEIGTKELEQGVISLKRRDNFETISLALNQVTTELPLLAQKMQKQMFDKAKEIEKSLIHEAKNYEEFKEIMHTTRGFIKVYWNEDKQIEAKIKQDTKATTRCMPLDQPTTPGIDFYTGQPADKVWLFAQAY
jgi:prolyl-tRNA synthetase